MKNTALLVIDFINEIVHPNGKISATSTFVQEHKVIEKTNHIIAYARQNNIPIGFVRVGFSENYIECPVHSPIFGKAKEFKALQLGQWGTEFHQALDFQSSDLVIEKHRVSAFYATSLDTFLRANKIEHIILTGVSTDMAIQLTAREAHDRDYQVTIVADACGAHTMEIHQNSLTLLQRVAEIRDSSSLV